MGTRRPPNGRLLLVLFGMAAVVALLDQCSKNWAIANLSAKEQVPLIGDLLSLQLTTNSGAAFSFASGMTWVFTVISLLVIGVVIRFARTLGSAWWAVGFGLLLGGALGNLYDRLFRPPSFGEGHVVDFINYWNQFIGNVADIAIVAAAVIIAVLAWRGVEIDGTHHKTVQSVPGLGSAESASSAREEAGSETAPAQAERSGAPAKDSDG